MDRLCKFSTSILAGNVATLMLVAMATDYWQHRGFDLTELRRRLDAGRSAFAAHEAERRMWGDPDVSTTTEDEAANRTDLMAAPDTSSYAMLGYRHAAFRGDYSLTGEPKRATVALLESPALLLKVKEARAAGSKGESADAPVFDLVFYYTEYGSLLRDCKQLESLSIQRIPFPPENKVRCEWFLFGRRSEHFISRHLPEVFILELTAAAFGLAALICTIASLAFGVRGNVQRDSGALTRASLLSIAAATSCTLTIALFHAKLNLRSRRPLFADEPPTLQLLAWLRPAEVVSFGWSFYLAWLCVLMSTAEAGMWLHQMDRRERDAEWDRNRDLVERIRGYYRDRNYVHGVFED